MKTKPVLLRAVPEDLHKALKIRAAAEGKQLYVLIIEILDAAMKTKKGGKS